MDCTTEIKDPFADEYPSGLPTNADEYELYTPSIGEGSFAKVFKARPLQSKQFVAIKTIDLTEHDADIGDLQKEVNVMRKLRHKNIVSVYTTFVHGESLWIVMPLMDGGSCLNVLKTSFAAGVKDENILATILKETLEGIVYMHKDNLIHRDIKAANILLSSTGEVQLADFGVAATMNDDGKRNRVTFTGTPCWMAPEVMMNKEKGYDSKADVWSFGITAMELAFGAAPYSTYQPMKIILMTLQEPAPTLESAYGAAAKQQFTNDFHDLIKKCLVKDPTKRPSARMLLSHKFFKKVAPASHLVEILIKPLPKRIFSVTKSIDEKQIQGENNSLGESAASKGVTAGVSRWEFDMDVIREAVAAGKEPQPVDLLQNGQPVIITTANEKKIEVSVFEEEGPTAGAPATTGSPATAAATIASADKDTSGEANTESAFSDLLPEDFSVQ